MIIFLHESPLIVEQSTESDAKTIVFTQSRRLLVLNISVGWSKHCV